MKTIILNFISLFRRFSVATWLNIAGLSIAFTAFIILMMQVSYDWGYDRFHKNADRLYRVQMITESGGRQPVFPRPVIESFLTSSPHIKEGAIISKKDLNIKNIVVDIDGIRTGYEEAYEKVSSNFPEMFDFNIIEGDVQALEQPNKALIPESLAKKLFGNSPAIGKHLEGEINVEIGGIYKDIPENSIIRNAIYQRVPDDEGMSEWNYHNYQAYVLLDDPKNIDLILDNFGKNYWPEEYNYKSNKIELINLPDVYYHTDISLETQQMKGSRLQVLIIFILALLIVGIAAVNFTNFSNALVPIRLKSINTQTVLGCSVDIIRISMVVEAILLCLLSFCIAIGLVFILSETSIKHLISGGIQLSSNMPLFLYTAGFAVIVGLISGLWPAHYITSFSPALVLKGNYGLSSKGKHLRNILVGTQFVASFILITCALFINIQNRYMTSSTLGFDSDQIAIVKLNQKLGQNTELLSRELKQVTGIEEVATVDKIIGADETSGQMGRNYLGEQILFSRMLADPTILDVLGIKVTDGRNFLPEDQLGNGGYIFNEIAKNQYALEAGQILSFDWEDIHLREEIIGFIDDIKYNSYHKESKPFAIFTAKGYRNYALIRILAGTNYYQLRESVREVTQRIDPENPFEIRLYNEVLENLYYKELFLAKQITFLGFIAVFISLMGIFGIVLFESEYKRREIGIRKVFGSTVNEVLLLLSNRYVRMLIICFILSMPVIWYAVSKWLESFVYKTPLYGWVFILSFVLVSFLTLLTVTIQNWRAATANPIDSIKTE